MTLMRYYDGSLVNGPQFHFRCLERAQDPFGTSLPAPSGISIRADLETGFDHLDSSILGLITASFSMGSMLAILFVPYATDILGRQTGVVIIIMPVALICMGFYIAVHCWQSCPRLRHRHRTRIFFNSAAAGLFSSLFLFVSSDNGKLPQQEHTGSSTVCWRWAHSPTAPCYFTQQSTTLCGTLGPRSAPGLRLVHSIFSNAALNEDLWMSGTELSP